MKQKRGPAPYARGRGEPKGGAHSDTWVRVEKTFEGHLLTTNTDLGAAVVAFERSPEYIRFVAEVVRVVGNAAVGRQLTSEGKLGIR